MEQKDAVVPTEKASEKDGKVISIDVEEARIQSRETLDLMGWVVCIESKIVDRVVVISVEAMRGGGDDGEPPFPLRYFSGGETPPCSDQKMWTEDEEKLQGEHVQHEHVSSESMGDGSGRRGILRSHSLTQGGTDYGANVPSHAMGREEEQRLLGAFLLAADEGAVEEGIRRMAEGKSNGDEPQLPSDGPTCLKKFTTLMASLGLKSTREQIRKDFEQVVVSNGLIEDDDGKPWNGACDPQGVVRGFTFEVFKRYYLARIHGELLESDIRQAWDDLHHGTGSKRMPHAKGQGDAEGAGVLEMGRPYIARAELHKILTGEGEVLTDEEVDELLRECRPDQEGRIVYEGYKRMLLDPSL